MQSTSIKSVYIHIPFCKNICSYCDFCKNFYNKNLVLPYLKELKSEVKENYRGEKISTLYIGGGTPSSLSINELDILFDITNNFNIDHDYEFTFECNYEDINDLMLCKLKEYKVNRLSIGIQIFNKKFEETLGRKINKKDMISKISLAKKYFNNINLDLMYGLPNQGIDDLKKDILDFINMKVSHVSTYALMVEEHTKLGINGTREANDDDMRKMYDTIIDMLSKNGYHHYEISNFSLKGFESKHNLTYWNNLEYYGFGAGASGFVTGVRYDNTKSISNYLKGKRRTYEETISLEQKIKDEVMLGFRKTDGINKAYFKDKYKIDFKDAFNVDDMIKDGLLKESALNVYISPEYLFVSNEIILKVISSINLN